MSIVSAKMLTKVYTGKIRAVDNLDLEIEAGQIFGFLGPNGAGKTTTLRMLATLIPIDSGEATVAGQDVRGNPPRYAVISAMWSVRRRRPVGYRPRRLNFTRAA